MLRFSTILPAPSPGLLTMGGLVAVVIWGLGAAWWLALLAGLPWLWVAPRPRSAAHAEDPPDLGMEVLQAICTLPRPLGMDRSQPEPGPAAAAGDLVLGRTRLILDCVGEGVMVLGPRGELLLSNAAAQRILGLRGPLRGDRSFLDHLSLSLKKLFAKGLSKVRQGRRSHYQVKAIQTAGKVLDLSFMQLPPSPAHPVECAVILITDMSQVYASSKATDGLLSCISHELRTPLTNIRAAVEILTEMPPDDPGERGEFLRVIEVQSAALNAVVDDVLEFSQLEASNEPWEIKPVALAGILHGVRRQEEGRLRERSLRLSIDLPEGEETMLLASEFRLTQVLSRLIDNAIKFSPAGGVIRVLAQQDGECIRVSVEDSGKGVDPSLREAVFEKFRQLSDVLTDKPSGMGLGLATCRRIMARMGGRIWCDDASLGGACFSLVLPEAVRPALV